MSPKLLTTRKLFMPADSSGISGNKYDSQRFYRHTQAKTYI